MLAILVAGAVAYSNSFEGVFVFDDEPAIAENPNIHRLWPLTEAVSAPPGTTVSGRPVAALSLAINYALAPRDARDAFREPAPGAPPSEMDRFRRNLRGYHAFNLIVHLATALALFGVVRRTLLALRSDDQFRESAAAFALVVSLLWVVHPLTTAAVTYVVQRAESLMALFYLLTLYCAIRSWQGSRWWVAGAAVACALGMGSKEAMVTAPFAVLLWDYVFAASRGSRREPDAGRTERAAAFRSVLARRWPLYASLAGTWVILAVLVFGDHRPHAAGFHFTDWPWWRYLATQAGVVLHYLKLAVVPTPLVLDYDWRAVTNLGAATVPGAVVVVMIGLTIVAVIRRSAAGFAAALFFLILAPTSSILPIVTEVAAEHRMYLPLAAVVAVASAAGRLVLRRAGVPALVGVALVAAAAVVLSAMTLARNRDYRSFERIWLDTIEKEPSNARARTNYATALLAQHRYAEAEKHLRAAVANEPASAEAQAALGVALCAQGRVDDGISHLQIAVGIAPGYAAAHQNLGEAYASAGRMADAVRHYETALRQRPDDVMLLNRIGWILATDPSEQVRNGARAVQLAERAVQVTNGSDVESFDTLAAAYAEAAKFSDAVSAAERSLALARATGRRDIVSELEMRLALYRRGEPYRQTR